MSTDFAITLTGLPVKQKNLRQQTIYVKEEIFSVNLSDNLRLSTVNLQFFIFLLDDLFVSFRARNLNSNLNWMLFSKRKCSLRALSKIFQIKKDTGTNNVHKLRLL